MSKRNRLGDDGGDFEIPEFEGAGEFIKEGLKNKKSRGWTIAAIIIGFLIFGYCSGTNNQSGSSSEQSAHSNTASEPQRSRSTTGQPSSRSASANRFELIGKVTGIDQNLNFIKIKINNSASIQIGQEVLVARYQPTSYEYSSAAVVETLNGNLAGLSPKGSMQHFQVGMNVYSIKP